MFFKLTIQEIVEVTEAVQAHDRCLGELFLFVPAKQFTGKQIKLSLLGFEPKITGVESDPSANCATTIERSYLFTRLKL